jgi:hypothetical protein
MYKTLLKSIFFLSAMLVICAGCSLDRPLYGAMEFDDAIESEEDAEYVINGVFSSFQSFNSFKSCTAALVLFSGDDFSSSSVSARGAGVWLNRMFTSSNDYVLNVWTTFYTGINRANSAREKLNDNPALSDAYKRQTDGEMTFIRAFAYYYMVRLFGGVPIRTEATEAESDRFLPRASVDSVYALIFKDFKNASEKCLPFSQQPDARFGRPAKGAAQALLASAYLTYANYCDLNNRPGDAQIYYQEAVNWCDSVIVSGEYRMLDNYADLFDVDKERAAYQEVIYGIQFTRDATASGSSSLGSEWPYITQPTSRRGVTGNLANLGGGNAQVKVQPWFYSQYVSDDYGTLDVHDYRTDVAFLTRWEGYSNNVPRTFITYPVVTTETVTRGTQPYLNKYIDPKGLDNSNHENDFFVIRFAEIYLIKAEALNELGRTEEGRIVFNAVRERARKANGTARIWPRDLQSGLSKAVFRMAVFNERGLELAGEGQRFFDCVRIRYMDTNVPMLQWRMQTFYPNMYESQRKLPAWNSSTRSWNSGRVDMTNVVDWHERFLLYPIPTTELDANPNFGKQNPGW